MSNEPSVNFASTQNIPKFARHTPITTHPLQIMRIVSMSLKFAGIPRPKPLALGAKHLVAALGLMNKNLAIWARLGVLLQQGNRSDSVRITNMFVIITTRLEFPAMCTRVFVAGCTLPSGRHKAIAFGISTTMNELLDVFNLVRTLSHQLVLGSIQISLKSHKLLDLCIDILDLFIDAGDETVMCDSSLCSR